MMNWKTVTLISILGGLMIGTLCIESRTSECVTTAVFIFLMLLILVILIYELLSPCCIHKRKMEIMQKELELKKEYENHLQKLENNRKTLPNQSELEEKNKRLQTENNQLRNDGISKAFELIKELSKKIDEQEELIKKLPNKSNPTIDVNIKS